MRQLHGLKTCSALSIGLSEACGCWMPTLHCLRSPVHDTLEKFLFYCEHPYYFLRLCCGDLGKQVISLREFETIQNEDRKSLTAKPFNLLWERQRQCLKEESWYASMPSSSAPSVEETAKADMPTYSECVIQTKKIRDC